jgi:DNA repair protein RadC
MMYVKDDSGQGAFRPANDTDILQEAVSAARRKLVTGFDMSSLEATKAVLPGLLAGKDYEVFCCAFINQDAKLIAFEEMFRGNAVMTPVFPRQVIKRALELNASHLLLVHNHPVGRSDPSPADVRTTMAVKVAAKVFEMEVLDHLVVGLDGIASIENLGLLKPARLMSSIIDDMRQEGMPKEMADLLEVIGKKREGLHNDTFRFR